MQVTDAAAEKVREIVGRFDPPLAGLRVGVKNAGCAGMAYTLDPVHEADPADDIVAAFFEHAEREVFSRGHVEYELNGAVKNKEQKTVVAIGSLRMQGDEDLQPFTIFIAPAK